MLGGGLKKFSLPLNHSYIQEVYNIIFFYIFHFTDPSIIFAFTRKTVTSLAVMLAFKDEWPLLILCPASLR